MFITNSSKRLIISKQHKKIYKKNICKFTLYFLMYFNIIMNLNYLLNKNEGYKLKYLDKK